MNTSTRKPKGISQEEYLGSQQHCDEQKFTTETNRRLQLIEMKLDEHLKSIQQIVAAYGSLDSSYKSDMNQFNIDMVGSLKGFSQRIGDIKTTTDQQNTKLKAIKDSMEQMVDRQEFDAIVNELLDQHVKLGKTFIDCKQETNALIETLKMEFSRQLKGLKEELLGRPTGIPELKKSIQVQLETVELNGQNAAIRSTNNEKHIMLLERKIENMAQIIKKMELSKKE